MSKLSRRYFLASTTRALIVASGGLALPRIARANVSPPPTDLALAPRPEPKLGRVTQFGADVHVEPTAASDIVRRAVRDEVLPIITQVEGVPMFKHNAIWYKIHDGYVYSSLVQPVMDTANAPQPELAKATFWGEITVPISDGRWTPGEAGKPGGRFYFGSVFRVIDAASDAAGEWWYRLGAGVSHGDGPWIPARHLRRFDPVKDLSPLSPDVVNKRIEISIAEQTMTAFEDDKPVLFTHVATGKGKNFTPRGSYRIWRKAIGQRMIGGEGSDRYDLPGVPFPVYFTYRGIAFHGAYWHNDFGVVRSHGCINMYSDLARWIWRWTTPTMSPEAVDVRFGSVGTPVRVI
jgi:hypothetical protein